MKLFLTSAGLPPETSEAFLGILGKNPEGLRVFFISTASYGEHPEGEAEYVKKDKQRLLELGFRVVEDVDLRNENEQSLRVKLENFDIIFVEGGNTFYLLKYIRESGFDKVLKEFLNKGGVYLGVSAGSYVAGPDISPANWKHADDQNIVGLKDLRGLELVDFYISPHYVPEHETILDENKHKVSRPIYALTDKQAILVEEGNVKFIGPGEFKKFE